MKRAIRVCLLATLCLMLCLSASAEQTERQYVTLGQTDLTVTAEGTTSVYFRAPEAGMYAFYSTSTKDPVGTLFAEDETGALTQLARDDDSGFNNNFQVEYELEANQVVRLDTHYLNEPEETLPITVVQMRTVVSDAALTLGETAFDLSEHTYVKYPFDPGEQPGYFSFTMSTPDATVALYDQNGACICGAANAISPIRLNGGERYTVRVGLGAHLTARKASLTINRYDGALEPVANVRIDGVPVEEGMTVPAYRALTVTFDGVDNAQYYMVYAGNNTWRVEPGQSVVVSYAPGSFGLQVEARADNWVTGTFYHNVQAEETEAQPELTLSVDSAVNLEDDLVTFTLAQTDAPATLWVANGNGGNASQEMLLLDGAYVLKHREYSGTCQVWATDALGRTSNRLEVTWNPPEQNEYPVYDSLTHLTLNGEPLVSGASVTAGAPLEIGFNLVTNARRYTLLIERNGQIVNSRDAEPNGLKPRFNNLSLTEGVWQLYISAYDSDYQELCASEVYEINAVAQTQSLPLSVDRTQAYVDESVTLTTTNDMLAYCWSVDKTGGNLHLPSLVGTLGGGSNTLTLGPNNGGYACQMEYYISDDYGRVSAPVTVDFLYHGSLQTPTVSIGDTVLTQEVFMDLTAGQEYTLTVSEQENATRYHVQVTYGLQSGGETVVTYEETTNTFTMPEDVRYMNVRAQAFAPGWETGDTGGLFVHVGTVADSFVSVTVNGEEWQENMTVRSLEETSISWNYVRNADNYMVEFAFDETQGANSGHGVGDPSLTTRFGLSADYVYFRVNAYDDGGNTLLCSTPFMRLSIDRTMPEASFTLTADRDSAYLGEPIQFTMERPAWLFFAAPNDMFVYQTGGGTTSATQSWSTVGDVTCFAIDEAGNYSNIVTVHYDAKGTLPEPQLYVNDQLFDGNMIFVPGETYTLRAACVADGLTDPVSYRFSLEYYDGNNQFISRDENDGAEITTGVPAAAGRCYVSITCSATGWQPYNRGLSLPCGVASSAFDSVLVNGEPYVEGMTVAPFDAVRISWNYIAGAEHFKIRFSDSQEHTAELWNHYSSPYKDIMIDDQCEWIDVDIEALARNGESLCKSALRLQVGDVAPEPAFTLTSNAQEIYIGESVRFSADRPFDLYQTVPPWPVMQIVYDQTTVANRTIDQVGTYTFIAVDSEGNRSNSVTVTAKSRGRLPTPSLYLNDELLDATTQSFLTPGETYTLRIECSADGLPDQINYSGSLQFFNAENVIISTLNVQGETTFTVPEDAVRCQGNFSAWTTGWEENATYRSFKCGVSSSTFDSVLVNGEEWQENMTVRSLEETVISWNYITNANHYVVDFAFNETQTVNTGYNMSEALLTTRFGLSADYVYFRVRAYDAPGGTLLSSTPFMRLSIDRTLPEASFTLTADRDSAYLGEPVQFTMERMASLFYTTSNYGLVNHLGGGMTSATYSWSTVGDVTCFAIDNAGNYSNIVTVHYDTKGTLPAPELYANDQPFDDRMIFEPGETYTLRAACVADGLTDPVSYRFSIHYYDGNGMLISSDEIDEAEITTSVPASADRCSMSIYCSAPGWQQYNRGFTIACGVASSSFDSVLVNGEPYVEGMTVTPFEQVRISWNYIVDAENFNIQIGDSQGHTTGYWSHYTNPHQDIMIDDQREWIDVDIEAVAVGGVSLCKTALRLQVGGVAPEPAFTLTSNAQEIYIGENVRFSADRPFDLYQTAPFGPVMQRVFSQTTVANCNIGQVGTYTFIAVDSEGNRSNSVTVTAKTKGKLPTPSLYLNDELLNINTPTFLTPGETYTLRVECSADGLTDPINYYGSLQFYNAENVIISTLDVQSEITFTVPEDAARGQGNFYAQATGWEQSATYRTFMCGVASSTFDSVLVNGEEWQENMTVRSLEETSISWNYITNATYYAVEFAFNETQQVNDRRGMGEPSFTTRFGLGADYVYFRVRAYDTSGGTLLLSSTPFMRLSIDHTPPEASFTLTADRDSAYIRDPIQFTMERPARFFYTASYDRFVNNIGGGTTSATHSWSTTGDVTYFAIDDAGNYSNVVTVHYDSKGTLPEPQLYVNDQPFDREMIFECGKTYTLRAACVADGLTDPVSYHLSFIYYDRNGELIRRDENDEGELTTSVPEEDSRCYMIISCSAPGWQGYNRSITLTCGITSSAFDSVTINGEPYVEGMTVAPYEDIRVSWNYITGAEHYNVTWTNGNGGYSERGCGSERNGMDFVFNASSSQITGTIRAIGDETELCTQTLRLNLSNVPAPSFQLSANVEETYLDSEVSLTWDHEAILYVIEPDQMFAYANRYTYVTSSQYTPRDLGTYSFIARDKDGNFSNVVTVACKSRGKLKVPALFFDGTKLKYGWNKDNPILTPGKTYEVTYAFTDAQPEGTYVDLEIYYNDNVGEYISEDYFELDPQPASITVPENVASMSMTVYVSAPGWEDVYAELEVQCGQVSSQLTNLRINSETLSGSATVPSYQPVRITYDYVTGAKEYVLYSPDNRSMRFETQNSGLSFIPFANGTYAFHLDALDENQEVISSETFTLTFTQSEPTFTITADRDGAPVEERIRFTSPVEGTWYFAKAGLDAADEYQQNGSSQTASFGESYAGIWNAWCVTADGRRSDVLAFEIYSYGKLAEPQLLINGAKPQEARILPGDKVRFALPAVENADGYDLYVSASGFYRSYSSLEQINAVTFTAPDVNCLSVYMEVYGDGYERNYVNWEIPLIQSGLSGLKVNGVAPEQAVITPYVPTQVSLDAIPGATVYSVETAHSYSDTVSQPALEVVMLPGEQWIRVQASAGDEYDTSWTILAWDTVAVKVSDAAFAPAFQLDVQTTADGQGAKTLTFGVSGHANAVKDLYFLTPNGWIGSYRSDDAVWEFTMDMTGEYQFWAVDEANQISNIITMSNALKPVADLRIDGGTPLSAGGTASVAFSATENALTYSLQVTGVTAEGQRCLLLSTNGAYEAINGASFYVPFSAVSVTCRVEAFADGYTSSIASASGDVTGTVSGYRLPASLRTIEEEAFSGVPAKLIVVPEGCETIGTNAFAGSAVSEVFLPGSVSSVAPNAFPEATHIFRVYEGADATIDWTLE